MENPCRIWELAGHVGASFDPSTLEVEARWVAVQHHLQLCRNLRLACTTWDPKSWFIFLLLTKENFKEKGFILAYSSMVQSIMVGKSRLQGLVAAHHVIAPIKLQRAMKACSAQSPFDIVQDLIPGKVPPIMGSSSYLTKPRDSLTGVPRSQISRRC